MIMPPPPLGDRWSEWGERLNTFLIRTLNRLQFLSPNDSAKDDGLLMWDRDIEHAVISLDGVWKPLSYGYNAYGMFYSTSNQTAATINTPTAIEWENTAFSVYIDVDATHASRIVFEKSGVYAIEFSGELHSESSNAKTMYVWPRINGVDVPGSTMVNTVAINDQRTTVSRSGIFQVSAGDYLEAMFAVDNTDLDFHGVAASAFAPASPSVSMVVKEMA